MYDWRAVEAIPVGKGKAAFAYYAICLSIPVAQAIPLLSGHGNNKRHLIWVTRFATVDSPLTW